MSTKHRDQSPGYHHVVTRGNNKRAIFLDDADRWFFSTTVDRIALKYGWTILAFCLMDNHYHLVIGVGERGLSRGMCELNTGYAVWFNARHGRVDHLFGKRYWNRRIPTEAGLLNVVRYVVQNPRRAGGSLALEAYAWTSYAATVGLAFARIRLAREEVLAVFGRTVEDAVAAFREFCTAQPLLMPARPEPP